jgi:hypothetical protein
MRICFKTWITDSHKDSLGIKELTNQLKYFHPDIPHILYGDKEMVEDRDKYPWMGFGNMYPISAMKYVNDFDLIIHIDGDSTVVGPLDEVIKGDYDVASVRNNHFGKGAGKGGIITIDNIPWDKFINVGLTAIRVDKPNGLKFLNEWLDGCRSGVLNGGWDDENNEFNRHFFNKEYDYNILDDVGSNVSYGLTNVFGKQTHWDSWKSLYMKNGEVYQKNPLGEEVKVKVLHMAGGGNAKRDVFKGRKMRQWLNEWVSPEVREHINKISNE